MASKAVVDAVEARLTSYWTATPFIGFNTQGAAPTDGSEFLSVQYPVANGEQITIGAPGNNLWREEGVIRFVLNVKRGVAGAVGQGLGWADTLASLFRGKQFSHVSTYAPSSPILDDSNDVGNYWQLSFAVPYYTDIFG